MGFTIKNTLVSFIARIGKKQKSYCTAIQIALNVFSDAPELLTLCEDSKLAALNRSPLAMGFLSGKFDANSQLPKDDVRGAGHEWVTMFKDGKPLPEFLEKLAVIREILTSDGRTPAQGALAWIWGRNPNTIPIPGFKNVKHVEENAKAMQLGPLGQDQMVEIETLLHR